MTDEILYLNHEGTSTFGDEEGMIISSILSLFENLLVIIYSKLHSKSCDYLYKLRYRVGTKWKKKI